MLRLAAISGDPERANRFTWRAKDLILIKCHRLFEVMLEGMENLLEALASCHQRIEAHLATLEELCRTAAQPAARVVLRYFQGEGLQHQRDENEDLFPLLRRLAAERERPEIAAVMGDLEREHATIERQWSRLRQQLELVAGGRGVLDADDVMRFAWLYRRHMEYEAAAIIPFAKEVLSAELRAGLAVRMAARRAIPV